MLEGAGLGDISLRADLDTVSRQTCNGTQATTFTPLSEKAEHTAVRLAASRTRWHAKRELAVLRGQKIKKSRRRKKKLTRLAMRLAKQMERDLNNLRAGDAILDVAPQTEGELALPDVYDTDSFLGDTE